jgi:hypothetical protein
MSTIKEFIEQNIYKISIDKKIFIKLWNIIDGDEWVFLSNEIIHDDMGYKKTCSSTKDFHRMLKKKYIELIDYIEVDKTHELVSSHYKTIIEKRGGNRRRYYIVTKRVLIILLSSSINNYRYLEHLYEIQNLMVQYYKSQYENYKESIEDLLKNETILKYSLSQEIKYLDILLLNKNQIELVYFIHEENDTNAFKVGHTGNLTERLAHLQCGNKNKLIVYKFIYCQSSGILETIIKKYLKDKQILGEWYSITSNDVDNIIEELES